MENPLTTTLLNHLWQPRELRNVISKLLTLYVMYFSSTLTQTEQTRVRRFRDWLEKKIENGTDIQQKDI